MVLSSALLGDTRPTASQWVPGRGGACADVPAVAAVVMSRAADGEITAVAAKPAAARWASL